MDASSPDAGHDASAPESADAAPDASDQDAGHDAGPFRPDADLDARLVPGDGGPPGSLGGRVLLRGLTEGIALRGEVYLDHTETFPTIAYGDGHCDIHRSPEPGDDIDGPFFSSPPRPDVDLGDVIIATNGEVRLEAPAIRRGTSVTYEGSAGGPPFVFGTNVTLLASGPPERAIVTVLVPGEVTTDTSSIGTRDGPVLVRYAGGEGAEFFHLNILGTRATVDCYPAAGTTSFVVPEDALAALDATAFVRISAERIDVVELDGRAVLVRTVSDYLD